jgi:phosphoribosylaminoimidazole (AIR) synthetase
VGLVAVLPPDSLAAVQAAARDDGVTTWVMGEIERGHRTVRFARP